MKQLALPAALATLFAFQPVEAENCCYEITPSTRPCECSQGPYITGDYLYFQATTDPINYSGKVSDLDLTNIIVGNVKAIDLDFDWSSGFRIGVGYNFCCDNWDVQLSWMSLHSNSFESFSSDEPTLLFIPDEFIIPSQDNLLLALFVEASWKLEFDSIDLELGRSYCLSSCFSTRPYFGLKALWSNQKFRTTSKDVFNKFDFLDNLVFFADTTQASTKGKAWGIGPKIGVSAKWDWFCGLGLFGNVSGAIMWTRFYSREFEFFGEIDISGTIPIFPPFSFTAPTQLPDEKKLAPVIEMQVGLDWLTYFSSDRFFFHLMAGYEVQHYWTHDALFFEDYLNLKGLVISASLGF